MGLRGSTQNRGAYTHDWRRKSPASCLGRCANHLEEHFVESEQVVAICYLVRLSSSIKPEQPAEVSSTVAAN